MTDALLAAVAGLAGIGLSGGIQVGIAWWRDRKDRRAAVRQVEAEVLRLRAALTTAIATTAAFVFLRELPEPAVYLAQRDRLARELSRRAWRTVTGAYSAYGIARSSSVIGVGISGDVEEAAEDRREAAEAERERWAGLFRPAAADAVKQMDKAQRALAPWRSRPKLWWRQRQRR